MHGRQALPQDAGREGRRRCIRHWAQHTAHTVAPLSSLPAHSRRCWGVGWEGSVGGYVPLPIPGEEGGGAAWQHLPPQQIQPWERHRNLGLGTAGANVSHVKYLQCRADVLKILAPRNLRCKPCCQSMQRIPMPKHGQDTQLFGESDLATALSIYRYGQHGDFWGQVCHAGSCWVLWPPSCTRCLP